VRVLESARQMIEEHGAVPTMSALARAVGISRQALYLHFPDRARLMLALVEHMDDDARFQAGVASVFDAADGAAAVRAWAALEAWRNPEIALGARALDSTRRTDPAASAAWADRTANRMRGAALVVERLRDEGRLDPTWTITEAAALLWELTSFRVWDDLVNDAGLTPARYIEVISAAALNAMGAPVAPPTRVPKRSKQANPARIG
jgi:AcrR family transcriptional regulator